MPTATTAPAPRPGLASRAVRTLLGGAIIAMLAAAVMSWVTTNLSLDLRQSEGPAAAERVARLQQANLALILVALILIVAALAVHIRRTGAPGRWITICAWTRRVEFQGRWITFEEFLAQGFNVRCTHGICEEEAMKLREADIAPEKS